MRKTKNVLLGLALSSIAFSVSAQTSDSDQLDMSNKSQAKNNWFISVGGGANLLIGEQDDEKSVSDRIGFGGELSVGKWFNPFFGMKTQLYVGKLRGFNYEDNQGGEYTNPDRSRTSQPKGFYDNTLNHVDGDLGPGFWQDFTSGALTLDLMANLTHLFRGYYRESAPIEVIPYVGLGFMHAIKSSTNPTYDGIAGKLGMRVNLNLNPKLAIYVEPQAYFTSDEFDGYVGNRGYDAIANAMLGIQYNIKKGFTTVEGLSQAEIEHLNGRINENRQMIGNQQDILERQQSLLDKLNKYNNEKPQQVTNQLVSGDKNKGYLPEYVRFGLNSSNIEVVEQAKLEDAAAYLKANPDSKLMLVGYADKKTGNSSLNYKLSCKRAEAVADELRRQGINPNRLIVKCVGDKEQPYDQNDWNRVVIMVERK